MSKPELRQSLVNYYFRVVREAYSDLMTIQNAIWWIGISYFQHHSLLKTGIPWVSYLLSPASFLVYDPQLARVL